MDAVLGESNSPEGARNSSQPHTLMSCDTEIGCPHPHAAFMSPVPWLRRVPLQAAAAHTLGMCFVQEVRCMC